MAANRSDLLLIKLNPEGILPEAEFAGTNNTKRVRALGRVQQSNTRHSFCLPRDLGDQMIDPKRP